MAHIVGVPKREPCKHCGLPIFFAERLAIDGLFYHRKCLRCARCATQLTVGSFYETESGAYVCETCPDEEKKMQISNNNGVEHFSELSSQVTDEHRQSFTEKLAMFQSNGKGLLQKSLSDEEKSKSLKRLTELYSKSCTHDANDIKQTINESDDVQIDKQNDDDEDDDGEDGNAVVTTELSTSESSDEEDDKPPSLLKTFPPSLNLPTIDVTKPKLPPIPSKANVLNKLYGKNIIDKVHKDNEKIDASTSSEKSQTQTTSEPPININEQSSNIEQQQNDNDSANIEENHKETPCISASIPQNEEKVNAIECNLNKNNSLPLDALNSLTNVTKENAEFIGASQHSNANVHHLEENKRDSNSIENDDNNDTRNIEHGTNIKNIYQYQPNLFAMENEVNIGKNQEKEQKQVQTEQNIQEQKSLSNNANKSVANKDDTNNLESIANIRENSISDNDTQNMVRSRLSQFEALLQSTEKKQTPNHSPRLKQSSALTENITKQKKSIEVNDKLNITNSIDVIVQSNEEVEFSLEANDEDIVINSNADSIKILNTSELNDIDGKRPVPRQRASLNVRLEEIANNVTSDSPPTPSKRKQKPTTSTFEPSDDKNQMVEDNLHNLDNEHKKLPEYSMNNENNVQKTDKTNYPNGLNPFGSDDDDDEVERNDSGGQVDRKQKEILNPFDSEDDEIELLKEKTSKKIPTNHRISTNPFGSDSENETDNDSLSAKRTPIPTPRKPMNGSILQQTTPEISTRMYNTLNPRMRLHTGDNFHGSDASLASTTNNIRTSSTLNRSNKVHGSMSSLASSSTLRHKKGRAPDIPTVRLSVSASSSPSHSIRATRKKRAAPPPPAKNHPINVLSTNLTADSTLEEDSLSSRHTISSESVVDFNPSEFAPSIESSYVSSSNEMSISSMEVNNLSREFKTDEITSEQLNESTPIKSIESTNIQRKLIPVDESLLDDLETNKNSNEMTAEERVTYRRKIIPDQIITPIKSIVVPTDRQCEKMKENKESQNKNRQSQIVMPSNVMEEASQVYSPNKSSYGKWKRRKGPAPSLPIPPRKVIQMLPLQEIRHELEVIEVQQQGLEKQGIMLEKMIRERCEGAENDNQPLNECKPNSKEVEDLILQLFELVNEKNELFRRQAELMYLRRQHRLEQEQADIEYEIRVLMAQPECNKTDSDKSREEALISRLVDVVQLRNEVIESLEMDRIREAEEDQSIKQRLEMHTAKRDEELSQQTPVKLSKKEKKKQKESKKLAKQKKMDADKDADETEISQTEKSKEKKKKKKFLF